VTPERQARQPGDRLLQAAGWTHQDCEDLSLEAAVGVAGRKSPLKTGEVDSPPFVDLTTVPDVWANRGTFHAAG